MSLCEPMETTEHRIRETDRYIDDAEKLAGVRWLSVQPGLKVHTEHFRFNQDLRCKASGSHAAARYSSRLRMNSRAFSGDMRVSSTFRKCSCALSCIALAASNRTK